MTTRKEFYNELNNLINEGELQITTNLNECIYIIEDLYISGDFCDGIRGVDHNVLLFEGINWDQVIRYGTILVPETKTYINNNSNLLLNELGYTQILEGDY